MPLLQATADMMSREDLETRIVEEIIDKEALFALLPFVSVNGKSYDYRRENTLGSASFLSPYEDVPESAADFTEVTEKLKILASDVDLDNFLTSTQSDTWDQLSLQLQAKAKVITRLFKRTLVIGDESVNSKEFSGIRKRIPAAQTLIAGANGGAVTFAMLDELKDAVKLGADCFMMREGTWRAIKALLRAMNGNTAPMIEIENFGVPVPAYDGLPVLINEFIPGDEVQGSATATTSIYALRLNEVDGFHGIHGGEAAGLKYEEIGQLEKKDAKRYRMKWYAGTALKATHSVARLKGITNI